MPDGLQQIHRVPRKPADGLREDNLDITRLTLLHQPEEFLSLCRSGAGNRVIRENTRIFPFGILLDQLAVIGNLRREGMV